MALHRHESLLNHGQGALGNETGFVVVRGNRRHQAAEREAASNAKMAIDTWKG
jgi:hypothetical protein